LALLLLLLVLLVLLLVLVLVGGVREKKKVPGQLVHHGGCFVVALERGRLTALGAQELLLLLLLLLVVVGVRARRARQPLQKEWLQTRMRGRWVASSANAS
jgi:hypothetical protein